MTEMTPIGKATRTVRLGQVFGCLPDDGLGYAIGQVLDPQIKVGIVGGVLTIFSSQRVSSLPTAPPVAFDLDVCTEPFITNKQGWLKGRFVTLFEQPVPDLGIVGFRTLRGTYLDSTGRDVDASAVQTEASWALTPFDYIASELTLARGSGDPEERRRKALAPRRYSDHTADGLVLISLHPAKLNGSQFDLDDLEAALNRELHVAAVGQVTGHVGAEDLLTLEVSGPNLPKVRRLLRKVLGELLPADSYTLH